MAKISKPAELPLPVTSKDKSGSWGHASGRIWSREKDLLGRAGVDRLYAATTVDEISRLLLEHRYPQKDTVLDMVHAERCQLYELLSEITPDDGFHHVLVLSNDAHNLKAALKMTLLEEEPDEEMFKSLMSRPSLLDSDLLWRSIVRGEKNIEMPEWANVVIARARQAYKADYDVASIDRSIDRDIHAMIARIASSLHDSWLTGYFAMVRDLKNFETLLRAHHRKMSDHVYESSLLADGLITRETWLSYYGADDQTCIDDLCDTPYKVMSSHFVTYKDKGGAALFSRDRDNLLYRYLARGMSTLSGAPRVIAYVMARESEFKNVRIALAVLVDGLKSESVRPLRRDFHRR
ncbi:MAG TPA: V-type ATPase subunit [Clostridia bacterium]|nr:V-type ATPase subunit [Clostridia bacterium]